DDLADLEPTLTRHDLPIGVDQGNQPVILPPYGATVLLAGTSGSGKSTFATAFLEGLSKHGYQFCIVDPEGDYGALPNTVTVGTPQAAPVLDDLVKVLDKPSQNAVVNLVGVPMAERPAFFDTLLPRLKAERVSWGRPHWIVVDEVHHVAPRGGERPRQGATDGDLTTGLLMITVHPEHVSEAMLASVNVVVIVGAGPDKTIGELAATLGVPPPQLDPTPLEPGEAFVWRPHRSDGAVRVRTTPPQSERRRHQRKYIEGTIPPEQSFYFRGPQGKLNLRAHNLTSFLDLADGVDEETWRFHLKAGEYSRWIADVVHDKDLAQDVAAIEREGNDRSARETRGAVRSAVEKRYMVGSAPM
ncbi:MAG TPA: DUF87 domain-containing protein, partial [Polyangia bacterium]|nr:DUF87 domain-containing protein [Polyangia bacterium]